MVGGWELNKKRTIISGIQSSRHQEDSPPAISPTQVTSPPTTSPTGEVISSPSGDEVVGGEVTCGGEMTGGEYSWWRDDRKP